MPAWSAAPGAVPYLGPEEVEACLPPSVARRAVERALQALRDGEAQVAPRSRVSSHGGDALLMAASLPEAWVLKVLHVRPQNPELGLPALVGVVLVADPKTGLPRAVLDGPTFTGIRTAALAAWATERLARRCQVVALLGAGFQARFQAEALLALGGVEELRLWNRTCQRAQRLADDLATRHPTLRLTVAAQVQDAARGADVVTVVTSSPHPLLTAADLSPHAHVNAMGAYLPTHRELASDVLAHATVYADTLEACQREAGDLLLAAAEGALDLGAVRPLWAALEGPPPQGRTVLKSVGSAVFDAAVAAAALGSWSSLS
jgi:ornithine cyclodeaminase/alanine dehydrogenase-like protein (mu-crystallin family)